MQTPQKRVGVAGQDGAVMIPDEVPQLGMGCAPTPRNSSPPRWDGGKLALARTAMDPARLGRMWPRTMRGVDRPRTPASTHSMLRTRWLYRTTRATSTHGQPMARKPVRIPCQSEGDGEDEQQGRDAPDHLQQQLTTASFRPPRCQRRRRRHADDQDSRTATKPTDRRAYEPATSREIIRPKRSVPSQRFGWRGCFPMPSASSSLWPPAEASTTRGAGHWRGGGVRSPCCSSGPQTSTGESTPSRGGR